MTAAERKAMDKAIANGIATALAAMGQGASATAAPTPTRVSPPRPWDMHGRNVGRDHTFTHTTKATANKPSRTGTYVALPIAEALAAVEAAYEAGFAYCVTAKK